MVLLRTLAIGRKLPGEVVFTVQVLLFTRGLLRGILLMFGSLQVVHIHSFVNARDL